MFLLVTVFLELTAQNDSSFSTSFKNHPPLQTSTKPKNSDLKNTKPKNQKAKKTKNLNEATNRPSKTLDPQVGEQIRFSADLRNAYDTEVNAQGFDPLGNLGVRLGRLPRFVRVG